MPLANWRHARLTRAFFPAKLGQWLGPLIAAGAAAVLVAIIVLTSGVLDLSASKPHPQGWAKLLHYAFTRSTRAHGADLVVPGNLGASAQIAKGAGYYGMACAHCHGGPGLGQNPVALSMRPQPQYLMRELRLFNERDLFWIVKHGVKYSAMPAWPVQDRDDEVWSLVAFLRAMPKMSPGTYRNLAYGDATETPRPSPIPALRDDVGQRPYAMVQANDGPQDEYHRARPTIGFDDFAMRGDVLATCARCHVNGGAGAAGGALPNLTLLNPVYFRKALLQFASGTRHSGFMLPVATQLSNEQIVALSRHYTAAPKPVQDVITPDAALVALGARIATNGIPAQRIGACANCHDITRAAAKAYPALDGQHAGYLIMRMRHFRDLPLPTVQGGNPMLAVADKLSDREIDAVSAYYAARSPAAPPVVAGRP